MINLRIHFPQEFFGIRRIPADSNITCQSAAVPGSELQGHQTTLRESKKKCSFCCISLAFELCEDFSQQFARLSDAWILVWRKVVPAETDVVRSRRVQEKIVH